MMKKSAWKANLHTHTSFCDGKNSPEEMVRSAVEKGFDVLGFSGHSYTPFDETYCMSLENTRRYQEEVRRQAETYRDQIRIFCGIEQDIYSDQPTEPYDYVIGSVHAVYRKDGRRGRYIYVDSDLAALKEAVSELYGGDYLALAEDYFSIVSQVVHKTGCQIVGHFDLLSDLAALKEAVSELYGGDYLALAEDYFSIVSQVVHKTGCQIVGHFDLLTKFNEQEHLFDESHPRYKEAVHQALSKLLQADPIFEINTGAMARGYRTSPYPSPSILRSIYQAGGRITINSDSHSASSLDFGFEAAREAARSCGFSVFWTMDEHGKFAEQPL